MAIFVIFFFFNDCSYCHHSFCSATCPSLSGANFRAGKPETVLRYSDPDSVLEKSVYNSFGYTIKGKKIFLILQQKKKKTCGEVLIFYNLL